MTAIFELIDKGDADGIRTLLAPTRRPETLATTRVSRR